ncbi:hypothetical protein [Olleya aquimaris]|uniref:Uncharacterized protein n=1 Tax=Olleya aquimaris TaxID=639310 RepID=A0A327RCJ0_9FLAO|nr:hypothetical protein [Olleya aquimaris]RAJ13243.1 hypothetical protein LY08_02143 [Olleya aquimaris]
MLSQLFAILFYYRTFALWSLGINILLLITGSSTLILALITKLFLVALLFYLVSEAEAKQKLSFYKKLGISDLKLFSVLYLIDAIITIGFLSVINEFI